MIKICGISFSNNVFTECLTPNIVEAPSEVNPIKLTLSGMELLLKKLIISLKYH